MSDQRTRVMSQGTGGQGGPHDGRRHMRYLVGGLIAVIIGLVIAIVVIAGNDGGTQENTGAPEQTRPILPAEPDPEDSSGGVTPEEENPSPEPSPDGGESGGSSGGGSGGVSPESPQPSGGQSGGIGP